MERQDTELEAPGAPAVRAEPVNGKNLSRAGEQSAIENLSVAQDERCNRQVAVQPKIVRTATQRHGWLWIRCHVAASGGLVRHWGGWVCNPYPPRCRVFAAWGHWSQDPVKGSGCYRGSGDRHPFP